MKAEKEKVEERECVWEVKRTRIGWVVGVGEGDTSES